MKYRFIEGGHSTHKAAADTAKIASDCGFSALRLNPGSRPSGNFALRLFKKKSAETKESGLPGILNDLHKGDIVLFQYPLHTSAHETRKFFAGAKKQGVFTIGLIFDPEILRERKQKPFKTAVRHSAQMDEQILPLFDHLIAHNKTMAKELKELGCSSVTCLELFDFLQESGSTRARFLDYSAAAAGNPKDKKSAYLNLLQEVEGVKFGLYCPEGYDPKEPDSRIKGFLKPENLPEAMSESFGIVWQGSDLEESLPENSGIAAACTPYLLSIYIAAGMPVIVWKYGPLASFVLKNNLGLALESLRDLRKAIRALDQSEYEQMAENVNEWKEKITSGKMLENALAASVEKIRKGG